jgi:hypothetical protein
MMSPSTRKRVFLGVLAATVALVVFMPAREDTSGAATGRAAAPGTAAATSGSALQADASRGLQLPERPGLGRSRGELFGAPPPPPRKIEEAKPEMPVAPPMPYRFAGKVRQGADEQVLVSKGELVFPVKVGETLDGAYRVLSIGADRIEVVYLPLNSKDSILVSSTLDVEPPEPVAAASPATMRPVASQPPAAAPLAGASAEAAGPAQLSWDGPKQVRAGANFSVALRLSSDQPLRSAPMQLRFEPGVLEALEVRPGKFFDQGNFAYRVNAQGSIFVGATAPGGSPGRDAELLVVTFKPIKAGATAELNVTSLSLQGLAGRMVAHDRVATFRVPITQ